MVINRKWYALYSNADDTAELYIYDVVGDAWYGIDAKTFAADLASLGGKDLKIRINSPGGSVFDGLTIYNLIREYRGATTSIIDGMGLSIASIIPLAADTVTIAESAYMMIHQPYTYMIGNAAEMRKEADNLDSVANTLANIYHKKTGMEIDDIIAAMDVETWYTAKQAAEIGLVDAVVDGPKEIAAQFSPDKLNKYSNIPEGFHFRREEIKLPEPEPVVSMLDVYRRRLEVKKATLT